VTLLDCAHALGVLNEGPVSEGHGPASAAVALAQDGSLAGPAVRRVVALLTRSGPVPADAATWFVPAWRARVGDVGAVLASWRALGPWHVEAYEAVAHRARVDLVSARGEGRTLTVVVDTTGLVRRLDLLPTAPLPPVRDWGDVDAALTTGGAASSALVVTRSAPGRSWSVLHDLRAEVARPGGSTYKLMLLDALLPALRDGSLAPDGLVALDATARSLPTGQLQDEPDGTALPVRRLVDLMVGPSDNTAADLLLRAVGRERVEEHVRASGHRHAHLLEPFPSSRELFEVAWADRRCRRAYAAASPGERRAILRRVAARPLTVSTADLTDSAHGEGLDWFSSAWDLVEVLARLRDAAADEPGGLVDRAFAQNPGVPLRPSRSRRVLFKAGTMPGVTAFCWLVEDLSGRQTSVVLQRSAPAPEVTADVRPLLAVGRAVLADLAR
jgi:beta-lactamase class A